MQGSQLNFVYCWIRILLLLTALHFSHIHAAFTLESNFHLPFDQWYKDGLFEEWDPSMDFCIHKYSITQTSTSNLDLNSPNVSCYIEGAQGSKWLVQLPKEEDKKEEQNRLPEPLLVQQALLLLGEMANEASLPLKHTALVGGLIEIVEFQHQGQISRELNSIINGKRSKEIIGRWNPKTSPSGAFFNRITGSIGIVFPAPEGEGETLVLFRCGPREMISEVRELDPRARFQIVIQTPRLCANPDFQPREKYAKIEEILIASSSLLGKSKLFYEQATTKMHDSGSGSEEQAKRAFFNLWKGMDLQEASRERAKNLVDVATEATSSPQAKKTKNAWNESIGQMGELKREIEDFISEFLEEEEQEEQEERGVKEEEKVNATKEENEEEEERRNSHKEINPLRQEL